MSIKNETHLTNIHHQFISHSDFDLHTCFITVFKRSEDAIYLANSNLAVPVFDNWTSQPSDGRPQLATRFGQFSAAGRKILQTSPWNLAKHSTKNCGL